MKALEEVFKVINRTNLAKGLGIAKQNLSRWKKVPPRHVTRVSQLTGIPREKILPSFYM